MMLIDLQNHLYMGEGELRALNDPMKQQGNNSMDSPVQVNL